MQIKVYKMKIFRYEITDSTNTRAREYAKSENPHFPAIFIADGQSAGRGRRGRSFDSKRGAGLYISFLVKPSGAAQDAVKITAKAAVSISRTLERVLGLSVGIKWVNDIFVGGKKLAGILTEGEIDSEGGFAFAVCGMGINLLSREFPPELRDIVTTVEDNTGNVPDREELISVLIEEFLSERDDAEIMTEYRRRSIVIGKKVTVNRISGQSFLATVLDITDSGGLLVEKESGEREELISAEVSLRFV